MPAYISPVFHTLRLCFTYYTCVSHVKLVFPDPFCLLPLQQLFMFSNFHEERRSIDIIPDPTDPPKELTMKTGGWGVGGGRSHNITRLSKIYSHQKVETRDIGQYGCSLTTNKQTKTSIETSKHQQTNKQKHNTKQVKTHTNKQQCSSILAKQ